MTPSARESLILAHLPDVPGYLRDRRPPYVDWEDFCGWGRVGLVEAADRFDPARGVPFGAFARVYVQNYARAAAVKYGRTVRVPAWLCGFPRPDRPRGPVAQADAARARGVGALESDHLESTRGGLDPELAARAEALLSTLDPDSAAALRRHFGLDGTADLDAKAGGPVVEAALDGLRGEPWDVARLRKAKYWRCRHADPETARAWRAWIDGRLAALGCVVRGYGARGAGPAQSR